MSVQPEPSGLELTTTRELTSYWQEHSDLPASELEAGPGEGEL